MLHAHLFQTVSYIEMFQSCILTQILIGISTRQYIVQNLTFLNVLQRLLNLTLQCTQTTLVQTTLTATFDLHSSVYIILSQIKVVLSYAIDDIIHHNIDFFLLFTAHFVVYGTQIAVHDFHNHAVVLHFVAFQQLIRQCNQTIRRLHLTLKDCILGFAHSLCRNLPYSGNIHLFDNLFLRIDLC